MNKFKELKEIIKGPVFSIVTPFKKDQSIDYASLGRYLMRVYESGGRIFYLMAYNSRFSELSFEEITALSKYVVSFIKNIDEKNIVIVADPLHCSTDVSIQFCKNAELIGADIISLIFREKFYSEEQVFLHYKKCAESTNIGILIHEMPFINGRGGAIINWPISLLDKVANIENVIAIKEDAKDDEYSNEVIDCLKDRLSIVISGGGKAQWLRFANKGCQAWLNGIGVFEPKLPVIFYEAFKNKNHNLVEMILEKVEKPFFDKIVNKYGWHLGIKACLEVRNIFPRYERMPMLPIDNQEMQFVKDKMDEIEIAIKEILIISNKI